MKAIGFQSEEIQEYFVLLLLVKCNLLIIKLKITKAQNAKKREHCIYVVNRYYNFCLCSTYSEILLYCMSKKS